MSHIPNLTIIIPSINSATYIDLLLDFYAQELGVPVTVYVDAKTTDDTLNVARCHADRVIVIPNEHPRVGEIIETMSRQCVTPWVLRIDDDELPTVAMMDFVRDAILTDADAYGFQRYQCAVCPEGRLLHHKSFDPASQRQWRLYRVDRVKYRTTGHTPNFYLNDLKLGDAPSEAAIIHLDWAVHSFERRKSKVERYDKHTPNDGTKFRKLILYEEEPGYANYFRRLYLREFDRTARALAERFPDLTVHRWHYSLGDTIDLASISAEGYLGCGWSHLEDWGRWSTGRRAELFLNLSSQPEKDLILAVRAQAFFDTAIRAQVVAVSANGDQIGEWVFETHVPADRWLRIPNALIRRDRILTLQFDIASPIAPIDIGLGADQRQLGLGLIFAKLSPASLFFSRRLIRWSDCIKKTTLRTIAVRMLALQKGNRMVV